jgi:hypothetical protein
MIDISELEQYFPKPGESISEGKYAFKVSIDQDSDAEIFIINLRITQEDTKEDHLIKFRIGLGKDRKTESEIHDTHKPHFEIDIYKREKTAFSATAYFTFNEATDDELMDYAKGTVHLICDMLDIFFEKHGLDKQHIIKIVYEVQVNEELAKFEPILIDALYECYKKSDLVVREGNERIVIKTEHNLGKYLDLPDLQPLYLPLMEKIKNENKQPKEK